MTTPHERTRAVIQTHELLKRLERDLSISEELRNTTTQLLRHYPTRGEVLLQGLFEETLPDNLLISPFFASRLTYQPTDQHFWHRWCRKCATLLLGCPR